MNNSFYFAPPFSFELAVGEGIAWVPLADLGVSQWTQNEYANIFKLPPEQKISLSFTAIDTLNKSFGDRYLETINVNASFSQIDEPAPSQLISKSESNSEISLSPI